MDITYKEEDRVLYNNDEKEAYEFVMNHIKSGEPCSIIGFAGRGKTGTYRGLKRIIAKKVGSNNQNIFLTYLIKSNTDVQVVVNEIKDSLKELKTTYVLIYIASGSNGTTLIDQLGSLRDEYGFKFIVVILSDLSPAYDAIKKKEKLLLRSLRISKPLNHADAMGVIHSFETRFQRTVSEEDKEFTYHLSGGAIGVMKSLFLLTADHKLTDLTIHAMLEDEGVSQRLDTILHDIPEPILNGIVNKTSLSMTDKEIATDFGIQVSSGALFSPLLIEYLKIKTRDESNDSLMELTAKEYSLLKMLQQSKELVVQREEVAQCIWGDNWEEQYSDWAIDQAIHRLRRKLRDSSAPYTILTKKGAGFVLKQS